MNHLNKTSLRNRILTLLSIIIIASYIYYLYKNSNQYVNLLQFSKLKIGALFALSFVTPIINGLINVYLLNGFGVNLPFKEGFLLAAATSLANQLPISGGIITKGYYLKQKYKLSYSKFIGAIIALSIIFIAANGLIGLSIILYWCLFTNVKINTLLILGFLLMVLSAFIFYLPLDNINLALKSKNRISKRIIEWLSQALKGWAFAKKNSLLVLKLLSLQSFMVISLGLRYWLAFSMLSQKLNFSEALLMSSGSVLTQLISIAPGGLGVREAIVGIIASVLGFDLSISVVAVGLDRLISTSTIILIGWISTIILGKKLLLNSQKENNENN